VMDDMQKWLAPKLGRFVTPRDHEPPLRPHPVDGE